MNDDDLIFQATHTPNNESQGTPPASGTDCGCPCPWWLLLVGAAVGGGVGYYAGRRSAETEDDTRAMGPGR